MIKEAWTIAVEALSWMEMRKISEPQALSRTAKQLGIDDRDTVRFARSLVTETARRQNFLDAFIGSAIRPIVLDRFDLGVQAFLRLYVYQTRIARKWKEIDLKEAQNIIRLARSTLGWKTLQPIESFLGVLLTQEPAIVYERKSDETRVALRTFHPEWFVQYCYRILGRTEAIALLQSNMSSPPIYLRLNTLREGKEEILRKLDDDGIRVDEVKPLTFAYKMIGTMKAIAKTRCFREGLITVQDKASCFAAESACPAPGMTVLEMCAAPGAQTIYMGQLMKNEGRIISVDYSRSRVASWIKNIHSAGVGIAEPLIADACHALLVGLEADVVVLDPPCTGTGVFGSLPSSKWRLTPRSVGRMADVQWRMLNSCAEYVKPGGTLLYSTFSITLEENEMLVERFLKWHPEFTSNEISTKMGSPGLRSLVSCRRLFPHVHDCNGVFVARLQKTNE